MKHLVSGIDMPLGHSQPCHSGDNASHAKENYKTSPFWLRQSFQNKLNLGNKTPKSVKHVSEGGRVGKKEGMDTKQLRPKADQAVSSVSAAPALAGYIGVAAQLKERLSLRG